MRRSLNEFRKGLTAALDGLRGAVRTPEVWRVYLGNLVWIVLLAAVLDTAGIWAVVHWTASSSDTPWWLALGWHLLRAGGILLVLLATPVLVLFAVRLLLPLLGERLFLAGLREVDRDRAVELDRAGLPLFNSIAFNLTRLLLFLALTLGVLLFSLVPGVGLVVGAPLQLYITARALAWELLDPYLDKRRMDFSRQTAYVREHRAALVGFALPCGLLLSIPLVGALAFGLTQAAVATLVSRVLEQPATED